MDFEGGLGQLGATGARRSSMQALLVSLVCYEGAGFASRSCCRKPRAALAEARLPWAESTAPSGLKKAETEWLQRFETASYLSAIHACHLFFVSLSTAALKLSSAPSTSLPHLSNSAPQSSKATVSHNVENEIFVQHDSTKCLASFFY